MNRNNEKSKLISWIKKHKAKLILAGISIPALLLAIHYRDTITDLFDYLKKKIQNGDTSQNTCANAFTNTLQSAVQQMSQPNNQSFDYSQGLTGNRLNPTNLGKKVLSSAQKINQLLVEKGFQTKMPNGDYALTETGKSLGIVKIKTTKYNHTFSNIEWDAKVLDYLFSIEELEQIANLRKRFSDYNIDTLISKINGGKYELHTCKK